MIVCICNNISDTQIREAIAAGASSLEDLQARMPIATDCGSCLNSVGDVLSECLQLAQSNGGLYYAA